MRKTKARCCRKNWNNSRFESVNFEGNTTIVQTSNNYLHIILIGERCNNYYIAMFSLNRHQKCDFKQETSPFFHIHSINFT